MWEPNMRESRRERALRLLLEQQAFINKCGGDLAGYIRKYGDPGVPPLDENGQPRTVRLPAGELIGLTKVPGEPGTYYLPHSGNGGTAIWEADTAELRRLEEEARQWRIGGIRSS